MVVDFPLKPSTFFVDVLHGNERVVYQYEDKGFVWMIKVQKGQLIRNKLRGHYMSLEEVLANKPSGSDTHWRQATEAEAIAFLFPDKPTTVMENAW